MRQNASRLQLRSPGKSTARSHALPARHSLLKPAESASLAPWLETGSAPRARSPEEAADLQDAAGNAQVEELIDDEDLGPHAEDAEPVESEAEDLVETHSDVGVDEDLVLPASDASSAMDLRFVDAGRIGSAPYGDSALAAGGCAAHAFMNGGQTGSVIWGGGGGAGARGNQPVGSIQVQLPPVYQSRSTGLFSGSEAWIRPLSGLLVVLRSWVGINSGDQGNGHFVTPAAAARINHHETLHVANTASHYRTHLQPLLARVREYTPWPFGGGRKALSFFQIGARALLTSIIGWLQAVQAFQAADTADNTPMGAVDVNDLASGTYPVDSGPGTVGGKAFQHRVHVPGEAAPT